jgi:hypothetical protein
VLFLAGLGVGSGGKEPVGGFVDGREGVGRVDMEAMVLFVLRRSPGHVIIPNSLPQIVNSVDKLQARTPHAGEFKELFASRL